MSFYLSKQTSVPDKVEVYGPTAQLELNSETATTTLTVGDDTTLDLGGFNLNITNLNTLQINGIHGTSGQVLMSSGNSTPSWENIGTATAQSIADILSNGLIPGDCGNLPITNLASLQTTPMNSTTLNIQTTLSETGLTMTNNYGNELSSLHIGQNTGGTGAINIAVSDTYAHTAILSGASLQVDTLLAVKIGDSNTSIGGAGQLLSAGAGESLLWVDPPNAVTRSDLQIISTSSGDCYVDPIPSENVNAMVWISPSAGSATARSIYLPDLEQAYFKGYHVTLRNDSGVQWTLKTANATILYSGNVGIGNLTLYSGSNSLRFMAFIDHNGSKSYMQV